MAGNKHVASDLVHTKSTSSFFLMTQTSGLWLLWLSIWIDVFILSLGFHWFFSKAVAIVPFFFWLVDAVELKKVVKTFLLWITELFFKNFDVGGAHNIPLTGPVIFACGPHNNQFIDGVVVLRALNARPDVGFIAAAKSCRKPYEGALIRSLDAIPVERPQDVAVEGTGLVKLKDMKYIQGNQTSFKTEVNVGDIIYIKGTVYKLKVEEVVSDIKLIVTPPKEIDGVKNIAMKSSQKFKIIPNLDHSKFYSSVFQRLSEGKSIGIFPEGGSHDRSDLLPLKAGISLIALEAMKLSGKAIPVVPVGINYLSGHRFRSRVFVEIGKPIIPDNALLAQFSKGGATKREAVSSFLNQIHVGLKRCTVGATDYTHFQFFRMMNKLYLPVNLDDSENSITEIEKLGMQRVFTSGYEKVKNEDDVKELFSKVLSYRKMLKAYSMPDHKVENSVPDESVVDVVISMIEIGLHMIVLLPLTIGAFICYLFFLPVLVPVRLYAAKKARDAVKKSTVKLEGKDVLGTWKILVCFVILPLHFNCILFYLWYVYGESYAVLFQCFGPFIYIFGIKCGETWKRVLNNTWILVANSYGSRKQSRLKELRDELKRKVRFIVGKYGWDEKAKANPETKQLYRRRSISSDSWADLDNEVNLQLFKNP